jgi:heptosyltransferase III
MTHFPYWLNKKFRRLATRMVTLTEAGSEAKGFDVHKERIERILLVRANFRLGNAILALPVIPIFRRNFPHARIDFVGSPTSRMLLQNLPIDHHYPITRRFPDASWAYFTLLKTLRSANYDLAVELSCSQSCLGSFIVGFSRARFRVGSQGNWDHWYNVRIPRPVDSNKYRALSALIAALGLTSNGYSSPSILTESEKVEGRRMIESILSKRPSPVVGVFVGGRRALGKNWPPENFRQLIASLYREGLKLVVFVGPEEKMLIETLKQGLPSDVPLVFEASLRTFSAMVLNCDLFITCDSGPMHLACALGVRTIAIFQKINIERWGPPPSLCRILYQPGGVLPDEVLEVTLAELFGRANDLRSKPDQEIKTT